MSAQAHTLFSLQDTCFILSAKWRDRILLAYYRRRLFVLAQTLIAQGA